MQTVTVNRETLNILKQLGASDKAEQVGDGFYTIDLDDDVVAGLMQYHEDIDEAIKRLYAISKGEAGRA